MATFGKRLKRAPGHKGETAYIMYHGTTMKAAREIKRKGFIPSAGGMLGRGVYVSRSFSKAACYPKRAKGQKRAVLKLSVRVGKVKAVDRQGHHLQKSWHQAGYDTAWVPPNCGMVKSGRQENCVWDPRRIRVLSIQSNDKESSDDESTDKSTDGEDDWDDEEEEENDTTASSSSESDEESTDSGDETSSRCSSDNLTDFNVNTDDMFSDHVDDRYSCHSNNHESSDEEGSNCDESNSDFKEADAYEGSGEFSDAWSNESDDE